MEIISGIEVVRLAIDLFDFGATVSEDAITDELDLDIVILNARKMEVLEYHEARLFKLKEVISRHSPDIGIVIISDLLSDVKIITCFDGWIR